MRKPPDCKKQDKAQQIRLRERIAKLPQLTSTHKLLAQESSVSALALTKDTLVENSQQKEKLAFCKTRCKRDAYLRNTGEQVAQQSSNYLPKINFVESAHKTLAPDVEDLISRSRTNQSYSSSRSEASQASEVFTGRFNHHITKLSSHNTSCSLGTCRNADPCVQVICEDTN